MKRFAWVLMVGLLAPPMTARAACTSVEVFIGDDCFLAYTSALARIPPAPPVGVDATGGLEVEAELTTLFGSAHAIAASGVLKALAINSGTTPAAVAAFGDTIFMSAPGILTFGVTAEGTLIGNAGGEMRLDITGGGSRTTELEHGMTTTSVIAFSPDFTPETFPSTWANTCSILFGHDFCGIASIEARLSVFAHDFGEADFFNTANFEIGLPPGVTAYSASGLFPGTLAFSVPEPASLALVGLGLAGMAIGRRWRTLK
jgi:hypothetical protein